jgi:hypothetical protein
VGNNDAEGAIDDDGLRLVVGDDDGANDDEGLLLGAQDGLVIRE